MVRRRKAEFRLPAGEFVEAMRELGRELGKELGRELGESFEKGLKEMGEGLKEMGRGLKEMGERFEKGFKEIAQGLASGPRAQLYVMAYLQGKSWEECEDIISKATLLATVPSQEERKKIIEQWKR